VLRPDPRTAGPDLRDSQALHRRVLSCFDGLDMTGGRILWALPTSGTLLIQAPVPPSTVLTDIGWSVRQTTCDYARRLAGLRVGDRVGYSLIGNPTFCHHPRVNGERFGNGTRLPRPPAEWEEWIRRQFDGLLHVSTAAHQTLGTSVGARRGQRIAHLRVLFTGTAAVADRDALLAKTAAGCGPAKAYGCGLLLITGV